MVFVYTTCENQQEAELLGRMIIKLKLGACVDFWPVHSIFNWEGEVKEITQTMLMITTLESKIEDVNELISEHHSYSVPLIAGVDMRRMNRAYKAWMGEQVG